MLKRIPFVAVLFLAVGPLAGAAGAEPGPEVDWLWGGGFHLGRSRGLEGPLLAAADRSLPRAALVDRGAAGGTGLASYSRPIMGR